MPSAELKITPEFLCKLFGLEYDGFTTVRTPLTGIPHIVVRVRHDNIPEGTEEVIGHVKGHGDGRIDFWWVPRLRSGMTLPLDAGHSGLVGPDGRPV